MGHQKKCVLKYEGQWHCRRCVSVKCVLCVCVLVSVCVLCVTCKCVLLTLGAHAQRGLQYLLSVSVCLSVCLLPL